MPGTINHRRGSRQQYDAGVTLASADVHAAAAAIAGGVVLTPCLPSRTLSQITGADVVLKFENHQFTASFKERGALNRIRALSPSERAAGVCAPSAGNHAQGVAYHAGRVGVPATIVMPRFTPAVKVSQTRAFGADVVLVGETFDDARIHAEGLVASRGLTLIHPYDDPLVMAGQGTVALEMLAQAPDLDALVVPVGGGGLAAGMAVAARGLRPNIAVYGVQTRRYPGVARAVYGGPEGQGGPTIAEGIAVKRPGSLTVPILASLATDVLLVDEGDLEEAVLLLLEVEKTVVEGAGAAPLAALLRHRAIFAGKRVGLVLSGGNIDPLLLASVIERGMVRTGRLVRIRIEIRDLPGSLSEATEIIGQANANIEEVSHQRAFTNLPLQTAEVDFVIRTRGREHVEDVLRSLGAAGYSARQITS
jgi:threonine dehydratase